MALQAASLVSSAFVVPKEGKSCASLKESSLLGVSLSDHVKADFSSSALKCKREFNQRVGTVRAQTTATATPAVNRASSEGKKTLRQGCCIVTGASSGLGLAAAKVYCVYQTWSSTLCLLPVIF